MKGVLASGEIAHIQSVSPQEGKNPFRIELPGILAPAEVVTAVIGAASVLTFGAAAVCQTAEEDGVAAEKLGLAHTYTII